MSKENELPKREATTITIEWDVNGVPDIRFKGGSINLILGLFPTGDSQGFTVRYVNVSPWQIQSFAWDAGIAADMNVRQFKIQQAQRAQAEGIVVPKGKVNPGDMKM